MVSANKQIASTTRLDLERIQSIIIHGVEKKIPLPTGNTLANPFSRRVHYQSELAVFMDSVLSY